jgi:hypothetical protein
LAAKGLTRETFCFIEFEVSGFDLLRLLPGLYFICRRFGRYFWQITFSESFKDLISDFVGDRSSSASMPGSYLINKINKIKILIHFYHLIIIEKN